LLDERPVALHVAVATPPEPLRAVVLAHEVLGVIDQLTDPVGVIEAVPVTVAVKVMVLPVFPVTPTLGVALLTVSVKVCLAVVPTALAACRQRV
jgi:hypothetical protein